MLTETVQPPPDDYERLLEDYHGTTADLQVEIDAREKADESARRMRRLASENLRGRLHALRELDAVKGLLKSTRGNLHHINAQLERSREELQTLRTRVQALTEVVDFHNRIAAEAGDRIFGEEPDES